MTDLQALLNTARSTPHSGAGQEALFLLLQGIVDSLTSQPTEEPAPADAPTGE